MGKSYTLEEATATGGQVSQACQLTRVESEKVIESSTGHDAKEKVAEAEFGDATSGMPAGVKPGDKDDPFRTFRRVKQAVLIVVWICLGLTGEIIGPTIPDLTERLCVNYEEISRALVGKSVGYGVGAIIGGFLNEIFYKHVDLLMSLSLFLMSVACACLPLVDSLVFVGCMLMLNGFGEGIINTGGNTMVMHLWGERTTAYMHALHFGSGFGALLAPQIARPFLSPEIDDENHTVCEEEDENFNGTTTSSESKIEIPYAIIGAFVFAFAFVVLIFYIKGPPKGFPVRVPNKSLKTLLSASSCSPGYTVFGIEILLLLFLYFMQAVGGQRAYSRFLFSFAIEADVQFTKDDASYLQSAFWASFTLSRLVGGPLAKFVPLNAIIVGDILGILVTSIVLAIWAPTVSAVLWVFTCFMGIFVALVFPNGMSWSNLQLQMNSMAVMLLLVGGSVGGFIYQSFTGSLFENVGPETLMYVMIGYAVALAVVYAVMQTLAVCHAKSHSPEVFDEIEDNQNEHIKEQRQGAKQTFDNNALT